jgi:hypothetical protein
VPAGSAPDALEVPAQRPLERDARRPLENAHSWPHGFVGEAVHTFKMPPVAFEKPSVLR